MSYLVAAMEHHARKLAHAVTRAVVEKCSGFSSYEAGDHLQHVHADMLADAEAEYEVAEPADYVDCPHCCGPVTQFDKLMCSYLLCGKATKTPAAAQRGENPAGVTPPTPAGSPDPSRVTVGAVRGEGSPADSDIPSSPAGERPTWVDWAVLAICDVLAEHTALVPIGDALVHCGGLDGECHSHYGDWELWREHVAGLIAERLYLASKPPLLADWPETGLDMGARIDGASEIFPQHRTTQK